MDNRDNKLGRTYEDMLYASFLLNSITTVSDAIYDALQYSSRRLSLILEDRSSEPYLPTPSVLTTALELSDEGEEMGQSDSRDHARGCGETAG